MNHLSPQPAIDPFCPYLKACLSIQLEITRYEISPRGRSRLLLDRVCQSQPWPMLQPGEQIMTPCTVVVDDQRRWKRPIASTIHTTNKMLKRCQIFRIMSKKFRMLELDRGHYRQSWMIVPEIVIKFVRLVDDVHALPAAIVRAETRHHRADFARRVHSRVNQCQREHRRRGAFPMYTADRQQAV